MRPKIHQTIIWKLQAHSIKVTTKSNTNMTDEGKREFDEIHKDNYEDGWVVLMPAQAVKETKNIEV